MIYKLRIALLDCAGKGSTGGTKKLLKLKSNYNLFELRRN
jgi:hypothetical protein